MHFLDLPPEIFHSIMEIYVASTVYQSDLKNLQLVNKFFCQGVTRAVCTTRRLFNVHNPEPFLTPYLLYMVSSDRRDDYLARTFKHVTHQVIKYENFEQKEPDLDGRIQRLRLAVSRAAIDFRVAGLEELMRGRPITELSTPCQEAPSYFFRLDAHEFRRSMDLGDGQTFDAPEHVLSVAAYIGNISLVEHLLGQGGVDLNARSNIFGPPLRNTALGGHLKIARLLLDKGADPDGGSHPRTEEVRQKVEERYGRSTFDRNPPKVQGRPGTALEAAAQRANKDMVHLLLQQKYYRSRSSVSYRRAAVYAAMGGDIDIFKTLLEGADLDTLSEFLLQTYWDYTLQCAAFHGRTEIIPLLLDNGARINRTPKDHTMLGQCTPLALAALNGHNETVLFLLQKGSGTNGGLCHPIYTAASRGFSRTVALLLDQGAGSHFSDSNPLACAARYGDVGVVRVFLERGLNLIPGRCPDKGESGTKATSIRIYGHPRVKRVFQEFGVPVLT